MIKSPRTLFGERVRALRVAAGWTQDAFAERVGFARSYMSKLETGGANPSLDAIAALATALEVRMVELLENQR